MMQESPSVRKALQFANQGQHGNKMQQGKNSTHFHYSVIATKKHPRKLT